MTLFECLGNEFQHDEACKYDIQLVVSREDPSTSFQSTEQAFYLIALLVFLRVGSTIASDDYAWGEPQASCPFGRLVCASRRPRTLGP